MDWSQQGKTFTCGLECTMILGLVAMQGQWVQGCIVSLLAHTAEVHNMNDSVVLGNAVGVCSSCTSCWAPQSLWFQQLVTRPQTVMVARASSVHTPACCRCLWESLVQLQTHTLVVGAGGQQGLEETLAAGMLSCDYTVSPTAGEDSTGGQARSKEVDTEALTTGSGGCAGQG